MHPQYLARSVQVGKARLDGGRVGQAQLADRSMNSWARHVKAILCPTMSYVYVYQARDGECFICWHDARYY